MVKQLCNDEEGFHNLFLIPLSMAFVVSKVSCRKQYYGVDINWVTLPRLRTQTYIEVSLGEMKIQTDWKEILFCVTIGIIAAIIIALIILFFLCWQQKRKLSRSTERTLSNTELTPLKNEYSGQGVYKVFSDSKPFSTDAFVAEISTSFKKSTEPGSSTNFTQPVRKLF